MTERNYAGLDVTCTDQGFMTQFDQWNKEIGVEIAKEENIEMTDEHWEVVKYLQEQYKAEVPLTIRKIGKSGVVDIKGFYQLFPDGPLKKSCRIAGIPKPVSCI